MAGSLTPRSFGYARDTQGSRLKQQYRRVSGARWSASPYSGPAAATLRAATKLADQALSAAERNGATTCSSCAKTFGLPAMMLPLSR